MWQYNIKEVDLWFILRKIYKDEDWNITTVLYWNWKWWDYRKESSKTYYFKDDAISNLIIARKRWNEPC